MLKYKDFVPDQIKAPGVFDKGKHQTFDDAVEAANGWLKENQQVNLVNLETVVLPNIWSRWEEGSADASIGTGEAPSRWHQFLRCWYHE